MPYRGTRRAPGERHVTGSEVIIESGRAGVVIK
jgi:hypothetical protein